MIIKGLQMLLIVAFSLRLRKITFYMWIKETSKLDQAKVTH